MKLPKTRIGKYIYWRKKANTLELKLEDRTNELLETQKKLLVLHERRKEDKDAIKDLKERVSLLEEIVNKKKKAK